MGVRRRGGQRSQHKAQDVGVAAEEATNSERSSAEAAPPKRGAQTRSNQGIKPDAAEVVLAIESLYVDQLKPFGRILRKRIAERFVEQQAAKTAGRSEPVGTDLPDVDIKHLRSMCDGSELLHIEPEEGGDWSAIIRGRPDPFVDIYSAADEYPDGLWQAAARYFEGLQDGEACLPGGRYSCAQALMKRQVDFLWGFSLGQVCHLVQLAISKHKILGYCNGAVVPYGRSQSRVKEECAVFQQPCSAAADAGAGANAASTLALASWETARQCLREILQNAATPGDSGPSMIPLSNVKRLFRSRYHVELSETALGHSKLSDLLQDQLFADICTVQLQGQGYIVVETQAPPMPSPISLADSLFAGPSASDCSLDVTPPARASYGEPRRLEFCPDEPLCFDDAGHSSGEPSPLLPLPTPLGSPGAPTPNTVSRWQAYSLWPSAMNSFPLTACGPVPMSLPNDLASDQSSWEEAQGCDSTGSTAESTGSAGAPQSPSPSLSRDRVMEPQSPAPDDPPMKVSLPMLDRHMEPGLLQRMHSATSEQGEATPAASAGPEPRRLLFCADEPLMMEDAGIFDRSPPGLLGVKNTFIHTAVAPLVTPLPGGAACRSRSLPKDVGSRGNAEEFSVVKELFPTLGYAQDTGPESVSTPAFLPPPTPSSPLFWSGYDRLAESMMHKPVLYPLNPVIRLADWL